MHLLPITSVTLDEIDRAVDLGQTPADVVALSFTDTDLSALAAAHARDRAVLPSLRLASLSRLRHPLSVDLYAETVIAHARFVLVRCLGGLDYWRYGLERVAAVCRERGIPFAALGGDDRPDPRLDALSTVEPPLLSRLDAYWQAGGADSLAQMLRQVAAVIGRPLLAADPRPLPRACAWDPAAGATALDATGSVAPDGPTALVLFYRSALLSGDTAPVAALLDALRQRGLAPTALAVSSLKEPEAVAVVRQAIEAGRPDVIVAITAFSAREDSGFVLDEADAPVLQAVTVGAPREAWAASARGLGGADLAMQVVLPEFDGRLVADPIAFKDEARLDPALEFACRTQVPDPAGIAAVADLAAAWARLRRTPRLERRLALVLSDYPARGGRAGFAVGLDTPASVLAILDDLAASGYDARRPCAAAELMPALVEAAPSFAVPLAAYRTWLDTLPPAAVEALVERWGEPSGDPAVERGAFRFRALQAGKVLLALQPDRAPGQDRKAVFHDMDLPPCHAYLAFYLGLRAVADVHALVHLGTHGTAEWLPGKAVAQGEACWPRLVRGALPVIYPFIINDPGEAAPAKRRLAAVTLGHLTPPVAAAGLHGEAEALRALVEELSAARVLDPRRADLVAREIMERAEASGLAAECGIGPDTPIEDALTRLDAHLCDLGEVAIRDGLHVYGRAPGPDALRAMTDGIAAALDGTADASALAQRLTESAAGESAALLRALEGRFVAPGPAGSPARGQLDVLPTGRNLVTLDPRAVPTRAAQRLGERAAAEVLRRHLQDTGDWPRRIVMDLWASPTMRSGGEDVAHALALMGVRPTWDHASTRVSGFEIVPLPVLDRPRVDVTARISGAFRDTFPAQVALLDQAARALARLDEEDEWNALAAARRRGEPLARIFGAAPGRYGAGTADLGLDGRWTERAELGQAYLARTSHAYGGPDASGTLDPDFAVRVEAAEAFVHVTDTPDRDILDGDDVADAVGGFAAAAGRVLPLYSVDTSRPARVSVRTIEEDAARLVRGRLTNPRWIEGQLRHGYRGAAELAQAVDAMYLFAATTRAVTDVQFEAVYAAFIGDESVARRLEDANPAAFAAMVARFADARRRGLWTTRRNSVAARLDALAGAAA